MRIDIDADITRASTLPGWAYRDPRVFEAARDRIFARSWQFLGDLTTMVRTPGAVWPLTLLQGCLDEPIVVTRDMDDRTHVLSNVCTHRGTIVCEHAGTERHLRCRYHGRRFGLDGRFQHMPEFEDVRGFPTGADDLASIPSGTFGPFLFASLRPACELDALIGPMRSRLGWLPLHEFRFDPARSRDYLVRANWALYCDNYLEGFHIPFVHSGLNEVLDYGSYVTELYPLANLQLGVAKSGSPGADSGAEEVFDLPPSSPDYGKPIAAYYYWLFPNTMFNFYPWGLSVNVVRPLGPDLTRVSFLSYVWDEKKLGIGAGAALDRVEREDESVVEAVQKGVRSRIYDRGRYSPSREQGVHHFHRLFAEHLGEF